jgi:trk system potassium uptake protein TrkA
VDEQYAIYDLTGPAEWDCKTVGALDIRKRYDLNILAVRESGKPSTVVNSETELREGQTILVLGQWKDVQKCFGI